MTATGARAGRRLGPVAVVALLLVGAATVASAVSGALAPASTDAPVRPVAGLMVAGGSTEDPDPVAPPPSVRGPHLPGVEGDRTVPAGSSRLWYHGDRWWAVLPTPDSGSHHVWAFDGAAGGWVDTGTVVDERPFASIEVAVAGDRVFVASTGSRDYASHALRMTRFTWDPGVGRWDRDADFPVVLAGEGAPGTKVAVTDDGRVWLARVELDRLLVGSTDDAGLGFDGFHPVPGQAGRVGGFDVVAQSDRLRVVWRSRDADLLGEAVASDGGWRTHEYPVYGVQGAGPIDAAPGSQRDDGLLVLLSTSLADRGSNEQDPSVVVVALTAARAQVSVVAANRDGLKHPRLVVDTDGHRVGVVGTGPGDDGTAPEGTAVAARVVVEKWADLEALDFGSGTGRRLIVAGGDPAAPLVPIAPIGNRSGSVVLAAVPSAGDWATAFEGHSPPGERPPSVSDTETQIEDTFESLPPGAPAPGVWAVSEGAEHGVEVVPADGRMGRSIQLTALEGERVTGCRSLAASGQQLIEVRARVRSSGRGTSSARLLTLHGAPGTRIGVWLSRRGELEWVTPAGRAATDRLVGDGGDLTVTITIDRAASMGAVQVVDAAGQVSSSGALGLTPDEIDSLDEVCVATPTGDPSATLRLDELVVQTRR